MARVAVENRIVKVQKRNRALVRFDAARIFKAIMRAAESIGGFEEDHLPGINDKVFDAWPTTDSIAGFLTDAVVMLLNSNPHHLIANFPPTIETIQDAVLHALRSYGFQNTADAYACYRWGRHWLREGAIGSPQFVGNGFPKEQVDRKLEWSRKRGCATVVELNHLVREARLKPLVEESLELYERSLDEAAGQILSRLGTGSVRMIWISGPSCAGKTTTTLKLAQRLERRGLRLLMLNLDDYFWSLVEHPTDWINDRNYETPEALDIQLLNQHLRSLLEGATIQKPTFDFKEGRRLASKPVKLEKDQLLLLDCLHGLYPPMTEGIDPAVQFRVYLDTQSATLEGDGSSTQRLVKASDIRLLRRMLRDARHRNHSPLRTLLHWHYVRAGELFSILPLSGLADYTIDTGFGFELLVLKAFFGPKSNHMPHPDDFAVYGGFLDAQIRYHRIRQLLDSVEGLSDDLVTRYDLIPGDAVLREFIGGGTVKIAHND